MTLKIIVLVLAVLGSGYSILLNHFRYRSANNPTPPNVSDVYDAATYQTWKAYSAAHCRLEYASEAVKLVINLVLLACNVYAAFFALFPASMGFFPVVLLETLVSFAVESVESYISTMVIEEKYGFNRSTKKTFVADRIRTLLLGLVLSCFLAGLLTVLHRGLGNWMILLFAGAIFLFTLLVSFLYPVFSRMGNKFVPLEEGELKDRLMELLTKHGYRVKAIEVMDASRRTTKLNAYFTGFGKMKTIVLFDNLVNAMSTDEICAVFAHELGHGLHKDVLKQQILNLGNLLLMAVVAWLAVLEPAVYVAFGFAEVNYGFATILMGVGLGVIQPLSSMVTNAYSRMAEYRADRQTVQEGYGRAMISALKTLAKENFAHLAPSPVNVVLEYSHPPLSQRIEAVERQLEEL